MTVAETTAGEPVEEASLQQNLGEFPAGRTDQGERSQRRYPRAASAKPAAAGRARQASIARLIQCAAAAKLPKLGWRMDDPVRLLLLWFIMPVWFLAGLADYLCHRASDIEHTSGWKESVLHLVMFAEIAVPLLMCLFFEINALISPS